MYCRQNDFLWGAVVGGTVATLTALLFTTKKGKQIQNQIAEKYEELEDAVKDGLSDAKEKVEDTAENAGKKIHQKLKKDDH